MGWIEKLHATYEQCANADMDGHRLLPIAHSTQKAQIEIVIGGNGEFRRARVLEKNESTTLIPCTESSCSRSGKQPANHPLCDKLQYVAGDFVKFGGVVTSGFLTDPCKPHRDYLHDLKVWREFSNHPKLVAVLRYVESGSVVADLVRAKIIPVANGKILREWPSEKKSAPAIYKALSNTQTADDAFVRWRIEDEVLDTGTWEDQSLIESWKIYYTTLKSAHGLCMVTGSELSLADQHPAKLRNDADKAKLISSNDTSGYTFRGRFLSSNEACTVGYEVTQKAHAALSWLVRRQGYRNGVQVYVAWSVGGKPVPDPWADTLALLLGSTATPAEAHEVASDAGQTFARNLARAMAGYAARLDPTEDIVVMGLDSATPGRMAIIYYRELRGSEFLERIRDWHARHAWPQNFGKDKHFTGTPAPHDIAEAAYGRRLDDKLKKATVERLLPCIVDGLSIPRDLVISVVRRASNRAGLEHWEWEKVLGIACALFRGSSASQGKEYQMALEEERTSRDYLYGRLLAVADSIENYALKMIEKPRDTAAAQLMQRFADRPYSTWRTIELRLCPYISRLRSSEKKKVRAFLASREKLLDEITCRLASADSTDDRPLTGEFLLGYHCQRAVWNTGTTEQPVEESAQEETPA